MRNSRRPTSKPKADTMKKASLKDTKPQKPAIALRNELKPRTRNQAACIRSIAENSVTIINSIAATGKTAITCGMAAEYLAFGKCDKILITRPMVQVGKHGGGLGFLPGVINEKFMPYLVPVIEELELYLGKDTVKYLLQTRVIEATPLELLRGRTLNAFIIVDESQNCTYEQLVCVLTRLGKGSKIVLTGDSNQKDLKDDAFEVIIRKLTNLNNVGICTMNRDDIQRDPIVGDILARLE